MEEFSILIGGKAGFGIDKASSVLAEILNKSGFRIYIYRDYPSLIRGGHTFSIIRMAKAKISSHRNSIDFLLALNQETLDFHKTRLQKNSVVIYDSDSVNPAGLPKDIQASGVPMAKIVKEENVSELMRNSCMIGAFCKAAGIADETLEEVFKQEFARELADNLRVAVRGFGEARELLKIASLNRESLPIFTGNEALSMGLVKAGLKSYIAYPMTPSSGILHFMANSAKEHGLKVIHPESEISVILMALGFSYAGVKSAVGTSGGGFCLMTEGLGFSGMAELPIVIVMGQRTGPSTGLPTYTGQSELNFVVSAGQGEFTRLVVAPGDAEEAYFWSAAALNVAWKFEIPSIILTDKTLAEGAFSFDVKSAGEVSEWVFPLRLQKEVYKINSYEHDESGITTEDPVITKRMQEKRVNKAGPLLQELDRYEPVKVYGKADAKKALLCWGSNKGVCTEVANTLGYKVIHPRVLWPFPLKRFQEACAGVESLVCVENNATAQLAGIINRYGIKTQANILKYDGRPFTVDELGEKVRGLKL